MNLNAPVPSLGVGLLYRPELTGFVERHAALVDYLEVTPGALWSDRGPEASPRYADRPHAVAFIRRIRKRMPVIPHSTGLSIGSAQRFRHQHVAQMQRWYEWLDFPWHSDHLSLEPTAQSVSEDAKVRSPCDGDALRWLIPRVQKVAASVPVPFALENNDRWYSVSGDEFDEAGFLNRLCVDAGCYLVLDLNNLLLNSDRQGKDPVGILARLDLDRVIEIHVATGVEHDLDEREARVARIPDSVADLLRYALLSCPNIGGVTLEPPQSGLNSAGQAALASELRRLRTLWRRYQPLPSRLAS